MPVLSVDAVERIQAIVAKYPAEALGAAARAARGPERGGLGEP